MSIINKMLQDLDMRNGRPGGEAKAGDAIRSIKDKGKLAGQKLRDQFDMTDHRWIRLRVLLAELETHLREGHVAFPSAEAYREFLNGLPEGVPYREDEAWRKRALRYLEAFSALAKEWEEIHAEWSGGDQRRRATPFFVRGAPRPSVALRMTPRI